MDKICSFFGHSKIKDGEELKRRVEITLEDLIKKGFTVFLFGTEDEIRTQKRLRSAGDCAII